VRPPTDYALLKEIYDRHRLDFEGELASNLRAAKILVPIDIPAIATKLGVDDNSVFGRLYYHLEPKYAPPPSPTGAKAVFLTPVAGEDVNCVNFPLLEAVVANLWQERRRNLLAFGIAALSLGVSLAALLVSLVA
jgi:hypothetical protein